MNFRPIFFKSLCDFAYFRKKIYEKSKANVYLFNFESFVFWQFYYIIKNLDFFELIRDVVNFLIIKLENFDNYRLSFEFLNIFMNKSQSKYHVPGTCKPLTIIY